MFYVSNKLVGIKDINLSINKKIELDVDKVQHLKIIGNYLFVTGQKFRKIDNSEANLLKCGDYEKYYSYEGDGNYTNSFLYIYDISNINKPELKSTFYFSYYQEPIIKSQNYYDEYYPVENVVIGTVLINFEEFNNPKIVCDYYSNNEEDNYYYPEDYMNFDYNSTFFDDYSWYDLFELIKKSHYNNGIGYAGSVNCPPLSRPISKNFYVHWLCYLL